MTDDRTPMRIEFWRRMAAQFGGPVLVLGCGTGQLAVAIESIGLAVTGVDADAEKLSHARLGTERADVDVRWIHADPRTLALPRRFGFVFLADALGAAFPAVAEQRALLASVRRHLAPEGAFGVAVDNDATRDGIDTLLDAAGLAVVAQYGDWDFAPFRRTSPRLVTLCRLAAAA